MKYRRKINGQWGPWEKMKIKSLDGLPLGSGIEFYGPKNKIPTGFLICDGSAISRTTYSDLFELIGTTTVGIDENDTSFNTLGKTGGSKYLQAHSHSKQMVWGEAGASYGYPDMFPYSNSKTTNQVTINSGGVYGTTTGNSGNLQPFISIWKLIKATNTTPTMASVVNTYNTSTEDTYSSDYINKQLEEKGEVVWVNTVGSPFSSTNASVSLGEYKKFRVYYFLDNHRTALKSGMVNIGNTLNISESSGNLTRQIDISSSQLYIHSGYYQGYNNDDAIIPSHIIGYK